MPFEQIPEFVKALPEINLPIAGARGWMVQGTGQQVVFIEFDETVELPEHTHDHQWEFALAGKVELHRLGGTEIIERGENFYVPAGQPHAATVHAGYRAMILFNSPDRYTPKTV